ncbi:SpoIIE family protein phosphatase [Nonomuraea sp. SBT364]|uniref:SpoIIE family protein phosphatase n=1 Tax=Nonomuraea sp. SBT364 TaxID=1580530 RepID=UPI00066B15CC|nr:SpoIIE family protein phosphatase [Nonomuraea sp. SBT364]
MGGADEHGGDGVSGLTFEVLEPAPVGVAVTRGREHRLLYTNRGYRSLFGDRPIGAPIREAFSDLASQDYFLLFDRVLATGEPVVVTDMPGDATLLTRAGQERFFTFSLSKTTFRDRPRDDRHGVLVMCLEVTDQVSAARRIQLIADERSRILRRYESLVRVSAQIVWVTGPRGGVNEHSPGWERVTGQSWEEFRGDGWLQAVHPDDRAPVAESWSRALERVPDRWEHIYRLRSAGGGYRHFEVSAVPIIQDGQVIEWVGTCTDIEQQWQQRCRRRLLDRAAEAMANRSTLEEMLGALADVIVPELADGCGVHLVTDLAEGLTGETTLVVERVATAAGPGLPRMAPFSAQRLTSEVRFVRAVREARPVLTTFPPGSPPYDIGPSGTRTWLENSRANSLAILPVTVNGTVAAVVTAATCGERPPIGRAGIDLLRQIFEQAHDTLRNVMRFQRARQIAFALQHSLLAEPPHVPGLRITARYRPSLAAAEVGGDWYDSFVLPDGATVLAIGDVAGHDLRAAVAMGQLRNMLRGMVVDRQEPPGEVLSRLNMVTETLYGEDTATCVLARIERHPDGHRLNYAVAGHPPPLLITHEGDGRFLEAGGNPMLGIPYHGAYVSARVPLPARSTLLLYTDGLVERPGESLDTGLARLLDHATSLARAPLDEFCDELLSRMPLSGEDDVAVIALRLPGEDHR